MTALFYLARQAAYRLKQFLLHWYVHGYLVLKKLKKLFVLKYSGLSCIVNPDSCFFYEL